MVIKIGLRYNFFCIGAVLLKNLQKIRKLQYVIYIVPRSVPGDLPVTSLPLRFFWWLSGAELVTSQLLLITTI